MDIPAWEAGKAVGVEYPAGEGWGPHAGFCIEPSRYVDAVSRPEWRGMCLLKRGSVFGSRTRYWAWKE